MIVQHEKQFCASAACRSECRISVGSETEQGFTPGPAPMKGLCHDCGQPEHWARNCLNRHKRQLEATGQSMNKVSRMSCVEAKDKNDYYWPNANEQRMLTDSTKEKVSCISSMTNPAVGPSLFLDLDIEGVPVVSMLDCGSIISRSLYRTTGEK